MSVLLSAIPAAIIPRRFVLHEERARAQREARLAGLSLSEWAKRRLFGPPLVTFTTDDGEVYEIPDLPADLSRASEAALAKVWKSQKPDGRYTSVEEQVEYGLNSIDESRKVEVSARNIVYIHNTIGEMIGFFHNRDHFPSLAAVQKFIGDKDAGAYHLLAECYYGKLYDMLPEDIHQAYDGGALDNPASPYYHQPYNEQGEDQKAAG